MRLGRVSRRYRLMSAVSSFSLVLVAFGPAVGSATEFVLLPPESTSGSFGMGTAPADINGGGFVSNPDGDSISFHFAAPFAFPSPTGGSASYFQIDSLGVTIAHAGQVYDVTCQTHPSSCTYLGADSPIGNGPSRFSMHADPPPFSGNPTVMVPGTFNMTLIATVFSGSTALLTLEFDRSGPAILTFDRFGGEWLFNSGFAQIDPTPEPTTLLLLGTTAAGLGVAARRRRCPS